LGRTAIQYHSSVIFATSFQRDFRNIKITALEQGIHSGRTSLFIETDLKTADHRLVTKALARFIAPKNY
jgi:hypothetical protein